MCASARVCGTPPLMHLHKEKHVRRQGAEVHMQICVNVNNISLSCLSGYNQVLALPTFKSMVYDRKQWQLVCFLNKECSGFTIKANKDRKKIDLGNDNQSNQIKFNVKVTKIEDGIKQIYK